ncbi:IS200/IS605 family transposase [Synechocystis salina]|uniref:IS200/IS605 family transposase n=1 Tax=Synechocystis salina LEGE 00031 TaxID=1828736 RepID=A0ABR9VZI6_9SYNC|nr:IS200/IS605 family transposase [Synechocystis salina]MBE9242652.1 IS200/IS605 family transposase [Synechocystis salina LEGE 00041]MBE9255651.1 IS200/IS605 family transposase [Synechocystis salina LEGE 00031]
MEVKRASHCVYQIRYHMVFCIKYRRGLLGLEERSNYLRQIFHEIGQRYWFDMEEMGTDGDHVHLFVGAAPKYAPSRVMQILKSISAREMFKRFPELKRQLWGGEFWSDGDYIGTVGDGVSIEIVRRYIQEQGDEKEKARMQQMNLFPI